MHIRKWKWLRNLALQQLLRVNPNYMSKCRWPPGGSLNDLLKRMVSIYRAVPTTLTPPSPHAPDSEKGRRTRKSRRPVAPSLGSAAGSAQSLKASRASRAKMQPPKKKAPTNRSPAFEDTAEDSSSFGWQVGEEHADVDTGDELQPSPQSSWQKVARNDWIRQEKLKAAKMKSRSAPPEKKKKKRSTRSGRFRDLAMPKSHTDYLPAPLPVVSKKSTKQSRKAFATRNKKSIEQFEAKLEHARKRRQDEEERLFRKTSYSNAQQLKEQGNPEHIELLLMRFENYEKQKTKGQDAHRKSLQAGETFTFKPALRDPDQLPSYISSHLESRRPFLARLEAESVTREKNNGKARKANASAEETFQPDVKLSSQSHAQRKKMAQKHEMWKQQREKNRLKDKQARQEKETKKKEAREKIGLTFEQREKDRLKQAQTKLDVRRRVAAQDARQRSNKRLMSNGTKKMLAANPDFSSRLFHSTKSFSRKSQRASSGSSQAHIGPATAGGRILSCGSQLDRPTTAPTLQEKNVKKQTSKQTGAGEGDPMRFILDPHPISSADFDRFVSGEGKQFGENMQKKPMNFVSRMDLDLWARTQRKKGEVFIKEVKDMEGCTFVPSTNWQWVQEDDLGQLPAGLHEGYNWRQEEHVERLFGDAKRRQRKQEELEYKFEEQDRAKQKRKKELLSKRRPAPPAQPRPGGAPGGRRQPSLAYHTKRPVLYQSQPQASLVPKATGPQSAHSSTPPPVPSALPAPAVRSSVPHPSPNTHPFGHPNSVDGARQIKSPSQGPAFVTSSDFGAAEPDASLNDTFDIDEVDQSEVDQLLKWASEV